MNTRIHLDGGNGAGTLSNYKRNPSEPDLDPETLLGLSEAAVGFRFDHATDLFDLATQPKNLDQARRQIEGLLKDVGVEPPAREHIKQRLDAVVGQIPQNRHNAISQLLPASKATRGVKRCLDIFVGLIASIIFAPLMVLIALALMAEGGPVFFRQKRVGRERQRFDCIKFRTMRPDAEDRLNLLLACNDAARAEWRVHQKLVDDPRVTRLGKLLRESSLDELPQLYNVFRGEMSLVGPRPIVAPEISGYHADRAYFGSVAFDDYAACLPGITGLWQVSGRHKTIYLDRVRLDRKYARDWSFWLDLKIIWKTIGVILRRSGR